MPDNDGASAAWANIAGHLQAIEVIAVTSLALYLANSRNDPDYQRAAALLEHIRQVIAQTAQELPPPVRGPAVRHGERLLQSLSENIRILRGEGSVSH